MPLYDFKCPKCGIFEQMASYDTEVIPCTCGKAASRQAVYKINHKIDGQSLPRRDDVSSTQEEMHKELLKRGWDTSRVVDEMRKAKFEDPNTGMLQLDMSKMTAEEPA